MKPERFHLFLLGLCAIAALLLAILAGPSAPLPDWWWAS